MLSTTIVLTALLVCMLALMASLLTGWGLQVLIQRRKAIDDPFLLTWTGLLSIVSVYAIVQSHGSTILLPVLPALGLYFWTRRKQEPALSAHYPLKAYGLVALISLAIYFSYFCLAFSQDASTVQYVNGDYLFYGRLAEYLNISGKENFRLDYIFPDRFTTEPYHYGDIWTGALLAKLSGIAPVKAQIIAAYPLLCVIFSLGVFSLLRTFDNNSLPDARRKGLAIGMAAVAALVSGFAILFPAFLKSAHPFSHNLGNAPKLLMVAIPTVATMFLIKGKHWNAAWIMLLCGGIAYVSVLPVFMLGLGLLYLVGLFKGDLKFKALLPSILLTIAAAAWMFYLYSKKSNDAGEVSFMNLSGINIRTAINIFIGGLFQFSIVVPFAVLLAVALISRKYTFRQVIKRMTSYDVAFLAALPIVGLVCWCGLYTLYVDSLQLFTNVLMPCMIVFAILSTWMACRLLKSPWVIGIALLLFGAAALQNYKYTYYTERVDKGDFAKAEGFIGKYGPGHMAGLSDTADQRYSFLFAKNTTLFQPLPFLSYIVPGYTNASLNAPFEPIDPKGTQAKTLTVMREWAPFDYYLDQRTDSLPFQDAAVAFMKDRNLRYLTRSPKSSLPAGLQAIVQDSVVFSDGWVLYRTQQ